MSEKTLFRISLIKNKNYICGMKKAFLSILSFAVLQLNAQWNATNDSATMGPGYAQNVYYSMKNGTVSSVDNNNWHLAFRTGLQTDGIRINSAVSSVTVALYLYPKGNISSWNNFDTSGGYGNWVRYENNQTDWEFGAFNRASVGFPDFSWGVYDMSTHIVTGDSLYLMVYKNGANTVLKKLWVESKAAGNWKFRFANVDGSNEHSAEIKNADHTDRNYVYYNLEQKQVVAQEPANNTWDIVFTRYMAIQGIGVYYPVMGVLSNVGTATIRATGKPTSEISLGDYLQDTSKLANVIGDDWKTFDNGTFRWKLADSTAFFLRSKEGAFWKLIFTNFGGQGNGKSFFTKQQVSPGVFVKPTLAKQNAIVYPNPFNNELTVNFENEVNETVTIRFLDMTGKEVFVQNALVVDNSLNISTDLLSTGIYTLHIEGVKTAIAQRIFKK